MHNHRSNPKNGLNKQKRKFKGEEKFPIKEKTDIWSYSLAEVILVGWVGPINVQLHAVGLQYMCGDI